jgi:superfamily II DNA/RNA helicase
MEILNTDKNSKLFKIFGYTHPSEIQKEVISNLGKNNNLVIIAQAGSGKTFSYLLCLLNRFDFGLNKLQAIIILPTRELAVQTSQYIDKINESEDLGNIKYQIIVGGYSKKEVKLENNTQIVIGTVGKLNKILTTTKNFDTRFLKTIVIDEADKVALQNKNKTFEKILNRLYKNDTEENINLLLVSASYSNITHKFYGQFAKEFKILKSENKEQTLELEQSKNNISEFYHVFKLDKKKTYFEHKYEILYRILQTLTFKQCLIFYNQKGKGEELAADLRDNGWSTTFIHGDLDQDQRILIYEKIKGLKVKLIVSTDLVIFH